MTTQLMDRFAYAAVLVLCAISSDARAAGDPLPSWNDGAARQAIVAFVEAVTTEGGTDHVAPADRIATFDNDGTLWGSHPLYTQGVFALDRVTALAPSTPNGRTRSRSRRCSRATARRSPGSPRATGRRSWPPPTPG